mmetsp:Transcript_44756/g.93905  ORF Transcript_44756/g.93905 Transcript_44756/m.93905 type:complete len:124 (-) Transcript_44756:694-1065(-)
MQREPAPKRVMPVQEARAFSLLRTAGINHLFARWTSIVRSAKPMMNGRVRGRNLQISLLDAFAPSVKELRSSLPIRSSVTTETPVYCKDSTNNVPNMDTVEEFSQINANIVAIWKNTGIVSAR